MSQPSDVIVIGAGIIGCAVAYELARRGASVELVDGRPVGMGATQASAGILAPYKEAPEDHPLSDFTDRSLSLYDDFVTRVRSDSGHPVTYVRTGTLDVAADEAAMVDLCTAAARLARRGVEAVLVDGRAVRTEEPHLSQAVLGGLLIPAHGFVSAAQLTHATAAAARRHGMRLAEQRRVTRIARSGEGMLVETERGTLTAGSVVLAAGSWSGSIAIDGVAAPVPVIPVRGQLVSLAWSGPQLRRVVWSPRCYLVPWDEGTVLVGATVEQVGFDERTTVAGVRDLLDAACALTPHAASAGFGGARAGLRPGTADDLPIVGTSSVLPRLMYATGHYRNGVLLAPLTAQLVADAMLEGRIDPALDSLSPSRFGDL
jgi:glycine oxidase